MAFVPPDGHEYMTVRAVQKHTLMNQYATKSMLRIRARVNDNQELADWLETAEQGDVLTTRDEQGSLVVVHFRTVT